MVTKQSFMRDGFMALTISASLKTRGGKGVYSTENVGSRKAIRKELRKQLSNLETQYYQGVTDKQHIENIKNLANTITSKFSKDLEGKRFRIGIAQKALNLHLKYMWCMGLIEITPPHCPFDARIISKLPNCQDINNWTQSDSINDYIRWVRDAKVEAEKRKSPTLSDWELQNWESDLQQ